MNQQRIAWEVEGYDKGAPFKVVVVRETLAEVVARLDVFVAESDGREILKIARIAFTL